MISLSVKERDAKGVSERSSDLVEITPEETLETPTTETISEKQADLSPAQKNSGQRLMIQEGALWAVMNAIAGTGGIVMTAFALYLKADGFAIGLLSSLPLVAALLQLWTPQMVARLGSRKLVCVITLGTSRVLLLPLAFVAMGAILFPDLSLLWLLIVLASITLASAFNAIGGTSWLSWAGTVIPAEKRAVYFSRRNFIMGIIGLVVSLFTGFFMDWWTIPASTKTGHQTHPGAYVLLFLIAGLCGVCTIFILRRTPDLPNPKDTPRPRLRDSLIETWQHLTLRRFLIFRSAWMFAVGICSPYYTVYLLQNLHLNFTQVFFLSNLGTVAGLLGMSWWGRKVEKLGCSRILYWTSWFKVLYVILWALVGPKDAFLPMMLLHSTLIIDAGLNLASGNLLMNLMPREGTGNVGYYSAFTAVMSLVSAVGPFMAGIIIGLIAGGNIVIAGVAFGGIQVMFLLSGILRVLALCLFRGFDDAQPAQ
ncbi:MAG TPA: MFS transporter [Chloroflexia bacterium]|nr:MFS transporter [Chloroflexia bacterium]